MDDALKITEVQQHRMPVMMNIGCGFAKIPNAINVDKHDVCEPDVVWDLNETPWPFEDFTADYIYARHVFEHLENWEGAFGECSRILKIGGRLEIRTPYHGNTISQTYRDHIPQLFARYTWYGLCVDGVDWRPANAWANTLKPYPMKFTKYIVIPRDRFVKWYLPKRLVLWMMNYLVNVGEEQRFLFVKIPEEDVLKTGWGGVR
jgi:SAM-dependent methyltransferase